MFGFLQKNQQSEKKEQKMSFQGLNPLKKQEIKEVSQSQVVEQVAEINILKQQMLNEAIEFHDQLDRLQHQLIRKSNELQIFTSKEMDQISQKNISLVREFIKYQENLIKKLEGKTTNWDHLEIQLNEVEFRVGKQMQEKNFPVKLAKIELLEQEIKSLMSEIQQINRENERNKF